MGLARRFKETLRGADTVARLGGDEFVVLLNELEDEDEVKMAVERLMAVFHKPVAVDNHLVEVKASIGYALYPQDSEDPETLIELADQAMYQAKSAGRDRIFRFGKNEMTESVTAKGT
jgi:diguanylate cyclase (GGDEF)-like protein